MFEDSLKLVAHEFHNPLRRLDARIDAAHSQIRVLLRAANSTAQHLAVHRAFEWVIATETAARRFRLL